MKACTQDNMGYLFDQYLVTELGSGQRLSMADTLSLWMNLLQRDYLRSRPLED